MKDKALLDAREEQQELEALHRLDEECVHQQRAGNYLKAFDCMERALVLRRHFFGIESEEVIQACRALAEMCNLLAMSFLQQDNYAVTIDLLKKAEVLTQRHHPSERATTLNNLACYYRRLGKLHSAMTSLKRALELEKRLENVRNAADTQLNMCAVLSQLGKHQEALEHAQEALITLQEGFIQGKHTTETSSDSTDTSSSRLDRISVMCIAYHNVGVEQEFLKDYAESVASYKKGIGLAEQYFGENHSITTTIRNSYLAAKRTLATKARVRPCSAARGQSPGKAGSRLFLSPRSGSLRSPSPLAKAQSGPQIPTPRSIIADALSRSPLSALPPLEVQSPPSADKKKKKKKTETHETENEAPGLSPTDPFFSPRFRFEDGSADTKTKNLASISPRSSVAANVEVQTPASSKGKRERRKSSVKKPPTTAKGGTRATIGSADERTNTTPTSRPGEGDIVVGVVESTNGNAEPLISPTTDGVSLPLDERSDVAEQFGTIETLADHATEDDANKPQSTITPQQGFSFQTGGGTEDSEVDPVEGAISIVLTKVIDKIVELENEVCSLGGSIDQEENHVIVDVMPQQEESTGDDPEVVNEENSAEIDARYGVPENMKVEHQDEIELPKSYDAPVVLHEKSKDILHDELQGVPDSASDVVEGEQPYQLEADHVVESDPTEVSTEIPDPIEDKQELADESFIDNTEANFEAPNMNFTEDTSHFENIEINAVNETSSEVRLETPTEGDFVCEDNEATAITDEQTQLPLAEGEEAGGVIADNDVYDNEETDRIEALPESSDEYGGSTEGEKIVPTGDVDEQDVGQEGEAPHFTNDAENEIVADSETQGNDIAEGNTNSEHYESYTSDEQTIVGVEAYQDRAGFVHQEEVGIEANEIAADPDNDIVEGNTNPEHCESYASDEHTILGVEAYQDGAGFVHQEEVGIEAHDTSGLDYVDEPEQGALYYELQDPGNVEGPRWSEPQHYWPHLESAGVEDTEHNQEHSMLSLEEHAIDDEKVRPSAHYDDQMQGHDRLADTPDSGEDTVDVDTDTEDTTAIK